MLSRLAAPRRQCRPGGRTRSRAGHRHGQRDRASLLHDLTNRYATATGRGVPPVENALSEALAKGGIVGPNEPHRFGLRSSSEADDELYLRSVARHARLTTHIGAGRRSVDEPRRLRLRRRIDRTLAIERPSGYPGRVCRAQQAGLPRLLGRAGRRRCTGSSRTSSSLCFSCGWTRPPCRYRQPSTYSMLGPPARRNATPPSASTS